MGTHFECAGVRSGSQEPDVAFGHSPWTMPENGFIRFLQALYRGAFGRSEWFETTGPLSPSTVSALLINLRNGGRSWSLEIMSISGRRWSSCNSCLGGLGLGSHGLEVKVRDPDGKTRRLNRRRDLSDNLDPLGAPAMGRPTNRDCVWQITREMDLDAVFRWCKSPAGRVCLGGSRRGLEKRDGLYRCCCLKLWAPVPVINPALLMRVVRCVRLRWFFMSAILRWSYTEGLAVPRGPTLTLTPSVGLSLTAELSHHHTFHMSWYADRFGFWQSLHFFPFFELFL